MLIRLQKIIAQAGISSRRKAEDLIRSGLVTVNGQLIRELGSKADPNKDHIKVKGRLLRIRQPLTYLIWNKPRGVVTTLSDPQGRPTVKDYLHGVKSRVFPVGRLDYDSEGLLLLTNDGELAHSLIHPKFEIPRTYWVKITGKITQEDLKKLRSGGSSPNGRYAPCGVEPMGLTANHSWIEMTLYEGQKREIRRMMDKIDHPVLKLKRVRLASLNLGSLSPGQIRYLTSKEVRSLQSYLSGEGRTTKSRGRNLTQTSKRKS